MTTVTTATPGQTTTFVLTEDLQIWFKGDLRDMMREGMRDAFPDETSAAIDVAIDADIADMDRVVYIAALEPGSEFVPARGLDLYLVNAHDEARSVWDATGDGNVCEVQNAAEALWMVIA